MRNITIVTLISEDLSEEQIALTKELKNSPNQLKRMQEDIKEELSNFVDNSVARIEVEFKLLQKGKTTTEIKARDYFEALSDSNLEISELQRGYNESQKEIS